MTWIQNYIVSEDTATRHIVFEWNEARGPVTSPPPVPEIGVEMVIYDVQFVVTRVVIDLPRRSVYVYVGEPDN